MKFQVTKPFRDIHTKKDYVENEILTVTQERGRELLKNVPDYVTLLNELEDQEKDLTQGNSDELENQEEESIQENTEELENHKESKNKKSKNK